MANITKIKAGKPTEKAKKPTEKPTKKPKKSTEKPKKKPAGKVKRFFTAPFRYIHDSWVELRQVRWPSRKANWKMVLAVFAYTALIMILIALLDIFFTWIFNLVLGK